MKIFSPIVISIIVSSGIHLSFVIISEPSAIMLPSSTGSIMVVTLKEKNTTKQSNTSSPIKESEITKPLNTSSPIKQEILKKITRQEPREKTEGKKQNSTLEFITNDENMKRSRARVATIIYKELNQYFTYPRLAIKQNWQGKVLLSLRVTSAGKIKNIYLTNSSGYNILDQAAINSLSKVDQLPGISSWLPFDIDLKFPVIYKLIEG